MSTGQVGCAASSLLAGLLDDSGSCPQALTEVARTRVSVHYETGRDDVPVLCVCTPEAVRLPASVVTATLPSRAVAARGGNLTDGVTTWRVARWWQPPRPRGLAPPYDLTRLAGVPLLDDVRPEELLGMGEGLTPSGDDVVAGALVAASAVAHPRRAVWQEETRSALRLRRTTAVSRGLLHHALDGYAIPPLADLLTAVCRGDAHRETRALLGVGHTSGAALAAGAMHVLLTHPAVRRSAA